MRETLLWEEIRCLAEQVVIEVVPLVLKEIPVDKER